MGLTYSKYFLPNEFTSIFEGGGNIFEWFGLFQHWFGIQTPSVYPSPQTLQLGATRNRDTGMSWSH